MKHFHILTLVILAFFCSSIHAQEKNRPKRYILIENYIFSAFPDSISRSDTKEMYSLATPAGSRAVGYVMNSPLPANVNKSALNVDSVPEGRLLLEMFEEARERSKRAFTAPKIKTGMTFPEFSAIDVAGRKWTSADVKDRVMVLNLWYTGCGPCRAEMPELSEWKNEMPDVMFFSATYEKADRAEPVLKKHGFNWINLVEDKQFVDWLGGKGYPMTIVVNKEGVITHIVNGTSPEKRAELKGKIIEAR